MGESVLQVLELISLATARNASDLHLSCGQVPNVRVRGRLEMLQQSACSPEQIFAFLEQVFGEKELKRFHQRREADTAFQHPDGVRVRVHAYFRQRLPSVAIRLFPRHIPLPEELHIPPVLLDLIQQEQGLLLVTGPTGSGKSTTIASLIHYFNQSQPLRIITLEDPIEYIHTPVQSMIEQREVGVDTVSFTQGVRSALRQDPDVIMIGELRDLETIQAAIRAAEAGKLVLGTLHTGRASAAVHRLVDVFAPEQQSLVCSQLASVLLGVVSQRLLPEQGSKKRIAAFEVLVNTTAMANLIRTDQRHQMQSLMQAGSAHGMQTLEAAIQQLIARGKIDSGFLSDKKRKCVGADHV